MKRITIGAVMLFCISCHGAHSNSNNGKDKIDRKAVVSRHDVHLTEVDTLGSLTVGNGKFAYTVDVTGLQSFPVAYANGVPLGTQSEWGWHSFPNDKHLTFKETLDTFNFNGNHPALYSVQKKTGRGKLASDYFRANPQRIQLGNIGLVLLKKDGSQATLLDIKDINQTLNLWTGIITSQFKLEGTPVEVITCADSSKDAIGFQIKSTLLKAGSIKVRFRYPTPMTSFADKAVNYANYAGNTTSLSQKDGQAIFLRKIDTTQYSVIAAWKGQAAVTQKGQNDFLLVPDTNQATFACTVDFQPSHNSSLNPSTALNFAAIKSHSTHSWQHFWQSGAAVDFGQCTDKRAFELERRVVLSQYLLRVQEAGNNPPQETGLTYNSWYGKPHMEMIWWHMAQWALWGRPALLSPALSWYTRAKGTAKAIAERQGYKGLRWPKMTDNQGRETSSNVGSFLIWQEPHLIYLAELIYQDTHNLDFMKKYQDLVFQTADFMASFATYDSLTGRFNLGKGIIPAQECFKASETFNSPYELAYWKWALQTAQNWRKRLQLQPNADWQEVIDHLAPLSIQNGLYKGAEDVVDSYSPNSPYTIDHPAVLMALSMLPAGSTVDTAIMSKTFDTVKKVWHWEHTWGWDFPMVAMTAARLHKPEEAINALFKDVKTNTYLVNGHNYQDGRLTIYLPGNGALLSAIALMCAGSKEDPEHNLGFPKNGQWNVKWEGFEQLP